MKKSALIVSIIFIALFFAMPAAAQYYGCNYHAYYDCQGSAVYWFDSCGNRQDLKMDCSTFGQTCQYGQCVTIQPKKPIQPTPTQPIAPETPAAPAQPTAPETPAQTSSQPIASVSSAAPSGFWGFLKHWYWWIIIGAVMIFFFVVVFRRLSKST